MQDFTGMTVAGSEPDIEDNEKPSSVVPDFSGMTVATSPSSDSGRFAGMTVAKTAEPEASLLGPLDRKTWSDAFGEISKKPYNYVPYVNMADVVNSGRMLHLARKVQRGEATDRESLFFDRWLADQQRDKSLGYKVWDTILKLPAFGIEFMTSAGLVRGGSMALKAGTKVALKEVLEQSSLRGAEKMGARMMGRFIGEDGASKGAQAIGKFFGEETGAQLGRLGNNWFKAEKDLFAKAGDVALRDIRNSAKEAALKAGAQHAIKAPFFSAAMLVNPVLGDQVAAATLQNMTPMFGLTQDEQGRLHRILVKDGDGAGLAFAKAFGDQAIENWSEQMGESLVLLKGMFGVGAERVIKAGMIGTGIQKAASYLQKNMGVPAPQALTMAKQYLLGRPGNDGLLERAGWNGWLGEMAEEAAGGLMRSAVGLQPWSMPDMENITAMGIGFLFNPLAIHQLAKDTAYETLYKKDFEDIHAAADLFGKNPSIKRDDGIELDLYRTESQAKPVADLLRRLVGYRQAEASEPNQGAWSRFKRWAWLDGANRAKAKKLFDAIDATSVETIVDRMGRSGIDMKNELTLRNAIQDITGKVIVPDNASAEQRKRIAEAASSDTKLIKDGKITGLMRQHEGQSGSILYVNVEEGGGHNALTPEEFMNLREQHPYMFAVRRANSKANINPLKYVDRQEDPSDLNQIAPEKIDAKNVHWWGQLLGVSQLDVRYNEPVGVWTYNVHGDEAYLNHVKARAERVRKLAHTVPLGSSVFLDGGNVVGGTVAEMRQHLGYDHEKFAGKRDDEMVYMYVKAFIDGGNNIHLSRGFRMADVSEEIVHGLTLYNPTPDKEGSKKVLDPFFKPFVESARKQIKKKGFTGYDKMTDEELMAKLLNARMLGHVSNYRGDYTNKIDRELQLVLDGHDNKDNQAEIENGTMIAAYLKNRADQLGWDEDTLDYISTSFSRYKKDGTYTHTGFQPQDLLGNLLAHITKHNNPNLDPDGKPVMPAMTPAIQPEYVKVRDHLVAELVHTHGVSHEVWAGKKIEEGGEVMRVILGQLFKDLYHGKLLMAGELPNVLTLAQMSMASQNQANKQAAKKQGKATKKQDDDNLDMGPIVEGFGDEAQESEASKAAKELKAIADAQKGSKPPEKGGKGKASTDHEKAGQGDPGKPQVPDKAAESLLGKKEPKTPPTPPAKTDEEDPYGDDAFNSFKSAENADDKVSQDREYKDQITNNIESGDPDDDDGVVEGFDEDQDETGLDKSQARQSDDSKPTGSTETEEKLLLRESVRVNNGLVKIASVMNPGVRIDREAGYMALDSLKRSEAWPMEEHQFSQAQLVWAAYEKWRVGPKELEANTDPAKEEEHKALLKRHKQALQKIKEISEIIEQQKFIWSHAHYPHARVVKIDENTTLVIPGGHARYDKRKQGDDTPVETKLVSQPSQVDQNNIKGAKYSNQYSFKAFAGKRSPGANVSSKELDTLLEMNVPWRNFTGARVKRGGKSGSWSNIPASNVTGRMFGDIANLEMLRSDTTESQYGFWMWVSRNGSKSKMLQMWVKDLAGAELESYLTRYEIYYKKAQKEEQDLMTHPEVLRTGEAYNKDLFAQRRRTDELRRWDFSIRAYGTGNWWIKSKTGSKIDGIENFTNLNKRKSKLTTPGLPFVGQIDFVVIDDFKQDPLMDGALFYTKATLTQKLIDSFRGVWYRPGESWLAKGFFVYNNEENADPETGSKGDLIMIKPGMFDIDELLRNTPEDSPRYKAYQAIKRIIESKNAIVVMDSAVKANGGGKLKAHPAFDSAANFLGGVENPQQVASMPVYKFDGNKGHRLYMTADPNHADEKEYETMLKQLFHVRFTLPGRYLDAVLDIENQVQKRMMELVKEDEITRESLRIERTVKKDGKEVTVQADPSDDDTLKFGLVQSLVRNGAEIANLADGMESVVVSRLMASSAHRQSSLKYPKEAAYVAPQGDKDFPGVEVVDVDKESDKENLRPASVNLPGAMDANMRGRYTKKSPKFKSVSDAEKFLLEDPQAVHDYPWMFWIDMRPDENGRPASKLTRIIKTEKILADQDGNFVFQGEGRVIVRIPLSGENLAAPVYLNESISRKDDADDSFRTNVVIISRELQKQFGADFDHDLLHVISLMANKDGSYDTSDSLVGLLNRAVLIWLQGLEVRTQTAAKLKYVVDLKTEIIRDFVKARKLAAIESGEITLNKQMNPYSVWGQMYTIDSSSEAKKALGIFAANTGFMRLADRQRMTGKYDSFEASGLTVTNRHDLELTPESIMLRDHIWLDYLVQIAVDDEKEDLLSWMGITRRTAPVLLALAFGSPVFVGRDEGLRYLTKAFEFLNSPAVKAYDRMLYRLTYEVQYPKRYIEGGEDAKPSIEKQLLSEFGSNVKPEERTDEQKKNLQDVETLIKLLKISDSANVFRGLMNFLVRSAGTPVLALEARNILRVVSQNEVPWIDTSKLTLAADRSILVPVIRSIQNDIESQMPAWSHDPLLDPGVVAMIESVERTQALLPGSPKWTKYIQELKLDLAGKINTSVMDLLAKAKYGAASYEEWEASEGESGIGRSSGSPAPNVYISIKDHNKGNPFIESWFYGDVFEDSKNALDKKLFQMGRDDRYLNPDDSKFKKLVAAFDSLDEDTKFRLMLAMLRYHGNNPGTAFGSWRSIALASKYGATFESMYQKANIEAKKQVLASYVAEAQKEEQAKKPQQPEPKPQEPAPEQPDLAPVYSQFVMADMKEAITTSMKELQPDSPAAAELFSWILKSEQKLPSLMVVEQETLDIGDRQTPALYDPVSHEIRMARSAFTSGDKGAAIFLMHELIHGFTHRELHTDEAFNKSMTDLYERTKKALEARGENLTDVYGFLNVSEFVAEAFSSKDFQRLLGSVEIDDGQVRPMNAFKKFMSLVMEAIEKVLGNQAGSKTALYRVMVETLNYIGEREAAIQLGELQEEESQEEPESTSTVQVSDQVTDQAPFVIVPSTEPHDVSAMRANNGKANMLNTAPGQPGWLGNPFKWSGNGGPKNVTREQVTAQFKAAFLGKIDSDPAFRAAVLALRGKRVGYYKGDVEGSHVKVIQDWLAGQSSTPVDLPSTPVAPPAQPARDESTSDIDKLIDGGINDLLKDYSAEFAALLSAPIKRPDGTPWGDLLKFDVVPRGRDTKVHLIFKENRFEYKDVMASKDLRGMLHKDDLTRMWRMNEMIKEAKGRAARSLVFSDKEVSALPATIDPSKLIFSNGTIADAHPKQAEAVIGAVAMASRAFMSTAGARTGEVMVVSGAAGTGKTTIMRSILRIIRLKHGERSDIANATPTHAANGVIRFLTSYWRKAFGQPGASATYQQEEAITTTGVLGGRAYAPIEDPTDENLREAGWIRGTPSDDGQVFYYPTARQVMNEAAAGRFVPPIATTRFLLVDESSMLKDIEFDLLMDYVTERGLKIVFLGDKPQLPQIRGKQSADDDDGPGRTVEEKKPDYGKVFTTPFKNSVTLEKVMRQGEGNYLLKILTDIREKILGEDPEKARHALKMPNEQVINEKGEGYVAVNMKGASAIIGGQFLKNKYYMNNPFVLRVFSGTRGDSGQFGAGMWNNLIYDKLFPGSRAAGRQLEQGTLLRSHINYQMPRGNKIPAGVTRLAEELHAVSYNNSDTFIVTWIGQKQSLSLPKIGALVGGLNVDDLLRPFNGMTGRWVDLEQAEYGRPGIGLDTHRIFVVEDEGPFDMAESRYRNLQELASRIKAVTNKNSKRELFMIHGMIKSFVVSLKGANKHDKVHFGLGYADTIYKGQGSQADMVVLDGRTINGTSKWGVFTKLQLWYVGLSRAAKTVIAVMDEFGPDVPQKIIDSIQAQIMNSEIKFSTPDFVEDSSQYGQIRADGVQTITPVIRQEAPQEEPVLISREKSGYGLKYSFKNHEYRVNIDTTGEVSYVHSNDGSQKGTDGIPELKRWLKQNPPRNQQGGVKPAGANGDIQELDRQTQFSVEYREDLPRDAQLDAKMTRFFDWWGISIIDDENLPDNVAASVSLIAKIVRLNPRRANRNTLPRAASVAAWSIMSGLGERTHELRHSRRQNPQTETQLKDMLAFGRYMTENRMNANSDKMLALLYADQKAENQGVPAETESVDRASDQISPEVLAQAILYPELALTWADRNGTVGEEIDKRDSEGWQQQTHALSESAAKVAEIAAEYGFVLSGSAALAKHGVLRRDPTKGHHDLDFVRNVTPTERGGFLLKDFSMLLSGMVRKQITDRLGYKTERITYSMKMQGMTFASEQRPFLVETPDGILTMDMFVNHAAQEEPIELDPAHQSFAAKGVINRVKDLVDYKEWRPFWMNESANHVTGYEYEVTVPGADTSQNFSLELMQDYIDPHVHKAMDPHDALHQGFWKIRKYMEKEILLGKNYTDRINKALGFDVENKVFWSEEPDGQGRYSVYDGGKVNETTGEPEKIQVFDSRTEAMRFVAKEMAARTKDGRYKKPTKEQLALQARVNEALTALREGTDKVVRGGELLPNGNPRKAFLILEVKDGKKRVISAMPYSLDGTRDVEIYDAGLAEVASLRAAGRKIEFEREGTHVTFEPVKAILDDYTAVFPDADARIKQALALYRASMMGRERINEQMRSILGREWVHYWDKGDTGAYVPHVYIHDEKESEVKKLRAAFKRRESSARVERRQYDSYVDAAQIGGLMPVTMRADELISAWYNDVWHAAVNKTAVALGMTMTDSDASPLWIANFKTDNELDKDIGRMKMILSPGMLMQSYNNLLDHVNALRVANGQKPVAGKKALPPGASGEDSWMKNLVINYRDLVSEAKPLLIKEGYRIPVASPDSDFKNIESFYVKKEALPGGKGMRSMPAESILMHLMQQPFSGNWIAGFSRFNNWSKMLGLSLSMFHPVSLLESFIAAHGANKKGVLELFWPPGLIQTIRSVKNTRYDAISRNKLIDKWALQGLKMDPTNPNYSTSQIHKDSEWIKTTFPKLAPVMNAWDWLHEKNSKFLWSKLLPTMKIYLAENTHRELLQNYKERGQVLSQEEDLKIQRELATYINDILGGQDFDQYIWATPQRMQLLHLLVFAPDWTLSALNSAGAYKVKGLKEALRYSPGKTHEDLLLNRYWPGMLGVVMTGIPFMMQAMVYALARAMPGPDDEEATPFVFLNEPGKRGFFDSGIAGHVDLTPLLMKFGWVPVIGYKGDTSGKRRVYLRWAKQSTEVFEGWLTEPTTTLFNKLSSGVRTVLEQVVGANTMGELGFHDKPFFAGIFKGEHGFTDSRVGYIGQKFVPMSVMSFLQGRPTTFFAPSSRGMSPYTAQTKLAELITAYAEKDVWNSINGSKELPANLAALGGDILEAVERNGYDPHAVLTASRRHVLAHLYKELFDNINEQKWGQTEKTANMILRVNSGAEDALRSLKQRYLHAGRELPEKTSERVVSLFDKAELERSERTLEQEFNDYLNQ